MVCWGPYLGAPSVIVVLVESVEVGPEVGWHEEDRGMTSSLSASPAHTGAAAYAAGHSDD